MATKSPRQFHSQWPNVAADTQLPNVSGATIQDSALEIGDIAFVTGGDMYVCIDATLGAAVWQIIGTAAGSRDRRAPSIIVGNALAGDTANDCDYVDPGDGSGIVAALAAAAVLGAPLDVYIRAGVYDADLGSIALPFVISSGVTVRGAGIGNTSIRGATKDNGGGFSQQVFSIGRRAELWDVQISVPPPTEPSAGLYVVASDNPEAMVQRVQVTFSGVWDQDEVGFTTLQGCFGGDAGSGMPYHFRIIDCLCGSASSPLPSFVSIAGVPVINGLCAVADPPSSGPGGVGAVVERLVSWGGDHGIVFNGDFGQAHDCVIHEPFRYGCWTIGAGNTFENCKVFMNALDNNYRGVLIDGARSEILHNVFYNVGQGAFGTVIDANFSGDNLIQGNRATAEGGWHFGIVLAATSNENIVNSNNMSGAYTSAGDYVDNGSGNDLAHNK